jgi:hypothetical protein
MRSDGAGAERFRGFRRGRAPHNPERGERAAPRVGEAPQVGQRDQMSLCSPFSPWTRVA